MKAVGQQPYAICFNAIRIFATGAIANWPVTSCTAVKKESALAEIGSISSTILFVIRKVLSNCLSLKIGVGEKWSSWIASFARSCWKQERRRRFIEAPLSSSSPRSRCRRTFKTTSATIARYCILDIILLFLLSCCFLFMLLLMVVYQQQRRMADPTNSKNAVTFPIAVMLSSRCKRNQNNTKIVLQCRDLRTIHFCLFNLNCCPFHISKREHASLPFITEAFRSSCKEKDSFSSKTHHLIQKVSLPSRML